MAKHPPRLWRCYEDDIYMIMRKVHAQEFTEYLNMVDERHQVDDGGRV